MIRHALARKEVTPPFKMPPNALLRKAKNPQFCNCTLEAFPRGAAPNDLLTAACGHLLGLPIFPAFVVAQAWAVSEAYLTLDLALFCVP